MLRLHAGALRRRRELRPALSGAALSWVDTPGRPDVVAYRRGRVTSVTVFGDDPFTVPAEWGEPVLTSIATAGRELAGESSGWFIVR